MDWNDTHNHFNTKSFPVQNDSLNCFTDKNRIIEINTTSSETNKIQNNKVKTNTKEIDYNSCKEREVTINH